MTMTENTYDNLDEALIAKIIEGRERFNAVTARWCAAELNMSAGLARHRLQKLQNDGRVDWNVMPGSLVVVGQPVPDPHSEELEANSSTEPSVPDEDPTPPRAAAKKKPAPKSAS